MGLPILILLILSQTTAANIFVGIALLCPCVTASIIPYGYLRHTKTLPDWLVGFQMWSLVPTTLAFSLYIHHSATAVLCACVALFSIVMRIRLWPLMLMYIVALNGLHSLIMDYPVELPALHKTFMTTHDLPLRIIALVGVNMTQLVVVGLGLYAIMKEFVERSDQADAAITMNLAVADKLRRYDTDGVALILAANKGRVDENLLEAFAAIQHNLQEYRPHIPDYVIAATTEKNISDKQKDNEDPSGGRHEDAVINLKIHAGVSHIDSNSDTDGAESNHSDTPNGPLGEIGGHDTDGSVPGANDSIRSTMSSMRREKDFGGDALTAHFYGRATTVFVRFGGPCLDAATDSAADREATTLTINTCVEVASQHARQERAADAHCAGQLHAAAHGHPPPRQVAAWCDLNVVDRAAGIEHHVRPGRERDCPPRGGCVRRGQQDEQDIHPAVPGGRAR